MYGFSHTHKKGRENDYYCSNESYSPNAYSEKEQRYSNFDNYHYGNTKKAVIISMFPTYPHDSEIEKQFKEYAKKWRKETGAYSVMSKIAGNDNYLDIIGMGMPVVPYILADLRNEPDFWHIALVHITKANPVNPEHIGDIVRMSEDWINWGIENNLI